MKFPKYIIMLQKDPNYNLRPGDILESLGTWVKAEHVIDGECTFGPGAYICRATGTLVNFGYEYEPSLFAVDKDNIWAELPENIYNILPKSQDKFSEQFKILSKCDLYPVIGCTTCKSFCRFGQNQK